MKKEKEKQEKGKEKRRGGRKTEEILQKKRRVWRAGTHLNVSRRRLRQVDL